MRKWIDIVEDVDSHPEVDWQELLRDVLSQHVAKGSYRLHGLIYQVYGLILDGIPFEDAINHIAGRAKVDPYELRANLIANFKRMRSDSESYDDSDKVQLIHQLNAIIS